MVLRPHVPSAWLAALAALAVPYLAQAYETGSVQASAAAVTEPRPWQRPLPQWLENRLQTQPRPGAVAPVVGIFDTTEAPMLNAIEPAGGGGGSAHGEAETDGHGAPKATGKSEDKKSFSGKVIGPGPGLPEVRIGDQTVQRYKEKLADAESQAMPKSLTVDAYARVLTQRLSLTPFAHSPRIGDVAAPVRIVLFEDLGCLECLEASKPVNAVLQDLLNQDPEKAKDLQLIWVHAPSKRHVGTNLPAFYAKVAARYNKFWEFRQALLQAPTTESDSAFALLAGLGLEPRDLRKTMMTEARRFYRELDGDQLQARSFGMSQPPALLVNGIRLGEGGVDVTLLADVVTYVRNRIALGLTEPPM